MSFKIEKLWRDYTFRKEPSIELAAPLSDRSLKLSLKWSWPLLAKTLNRIEC